MGFILDISVTRLRAGDTIQFGIDANTYTITVINPQNQPSTLEVQGTSDVIPQENEWLVAVDRLENAISKINPVQTVESNNTVISIEFINGVNFTSFTVNDTNGSLVNGVQVVATNGVITNLGSVLVPNITVTSIDHKLIEYGLYTSLNYPHGNMGDKLETVISFTSAGSFSVLDFYYGWTDNNTQLYPLASQNIYQIDQSLFTDITTGSLQKYTGNTASINAVAPLQGNKVESINLAFLGGNDYELTIVHYVPILPRPTDRTPDNNLNKPVEIETSLKFIFQVDLKADILEPNATESTSKQNLTPFVSNGNIGYIGEVYQTGQQPYTLNNFVWNNQDDELNSGFTTGGTITLNKVSGSFDASHDVIVKIQKLTDVFNQSETQLQNYDFDSVQIKLDSVAVSSTTIQNVEGSFSGSTATITFDIAPAKITSAYALWVSVADGTANKGNQNVLLKVSNAINSADDTTVIFGTYPSAPKAEYNYNFHYLDPIADSFNQVKSYIDDFVVSRFRIENTNTGINTLNSITIRIRANNSVLETFTVTPNDFVSNVATISRAFNLVSGDIRNNITFTDNLDGTIDVVYPFQIIDSFVNGENVVQETLATYTQNTAVGDLEFTNNWISPTFELGQYNLSKNGATEAQVTLPPSNIKFYDETGTTEVGVILSNAKTRVIATFEESNLNDFLADPSAPFTYSDNVFVENYLCGYLGINTNNNVQSEYIRFHNLRDNELSVWESVQVGYYAELVRVDIDTATLTAVLDNEKIKEVFGEDFNCLKVTARLDKIQTAFVAAKAYKNDSYSNGYS